MAGNYDKYGNYDFSMFEPKPVSFDHNAARKIATLPGVGERAADSGMRLVTRKKKTTVEAKNENASHGSACGKGTYGCRCFALAFCGSALQ